MSPRAKKAASSAISYEDNFSELKQIVEKLETGKVTLEE
jgi:exonuclease VII small subunit